MKKNRFTFSIAFILVLFGALKVSAQSASMQIIHNSPDYIIDTVDIWANDVKIVNDLPFRKATQMLSIDSGDYTITIAKKFSTDSSALYSLLKVEGFRVDTGKTYLAFISGVVDTTVYATNPEGIDRSLAFVSTNSYKTTTTTGNIELSFFNGTPDANPWDLNQISNPGATKIGDNVSYNSLTGFSVLTAGNTIFNLTSADSSVFVGAFGLNTAALSGKTGCVFSSGVMDTISNPTLAPLRKFYVAYSNGTVVPFNKLTGDIQIVHNSADITLDSVDVYINGTLAMDNMAFREATPFMHQNAYVPFSIAIAPKTSTGVSDAFYSKSAVLDTVNYYCITYGLVNTSLYVPNPNGRSTAFDVEIYKGAHKLAVLNKNVDLLYFHSSTDLQTTTCRGDDQVQFLSKNDSYGDFHGYGVHTALDNINMELKDALTDAVLYTGYANLANHQAQAGLVFTSGFLTANDSTNQNGDTLIMFVVWPDGDVDSIAPEKPVTGIRENVFADAHLSVFPNPANGAFTVSMDMLKPATVSVTVKDMVGKTVFAAENRLTTGSNTIQLSTSDYLPGIYFVTLSSDGESYTRKVSVVK